MQKRLNYGPAEEGIGNTVHIVGNFTTAGASAPSVFSSGPFTVTRTGVGQLVITFKENFVELLMADVAVQDATGSAKRALITATSPGSANAGGTINVETQVTVGTAADLTGPVIHFEVYWRKGALKK